MAEEVVTPVETEEVKTGQEETSTTDTETKTETEVEEKEEVKEEEKEPKEIKDVVDYKVEAEKWETSYKEKQKWFDQKVNELTEKLSKVTKGEKVEEAPKFEVLGVDKAYELAITDPAKYKEYKDNETKYMAEQAVGIIAEREKKESERKQTIDIYNKMLEAHPELKNPESEFYKTVDAKIAEYKLKLDNPKEISIAKLIADNLALNKKVVEVAEKAKQEAIKSVKTKESQNKVEKPAVETTTVELSAEEKKIADRMGVSYESYAANKA